MTAPLYDISPPIRAGAPVWPGDTEYSEARSWAIGPGCPVNVSRFTMSTHTGSHADAPFHYAAEGARAGALDLSRYLGPCRLIDATDGEMTMEGRRLNDVASYELLSYGIAHVPENRRLFPKLTVEENLRMGAFVPQARAHFDERLARVYQLFPRMKERRRQQAGYLSGGEQQMLAIGRGLMSRPKLMMLDEPSLGLAPLLTAEIFRIVRQLVEKERIAVLLVEQNAALALELADHGYVIENGRIVLEGKADALRQNSDIKEFYLGLNDVGGRKSYRDVKRYRRRKRWLS